VTVLQENGINFEGLFYNPNIHPMDEFLKRKENVQKFSEIKGIPVTYFDDFMQDKWEGVGEDDSIRCSMCYSLRLDKTAAYAAEKGFDAFTTTLLVSPYQKHELIKELGEKYASRYGVAFYYTDFRPGFRQGQQLAKEMGLYRQKFCGCIISYNRSPYTKKDKNGIEPGL
jgi:predicted adenine nucleotide alpha hydrolase (AANH) superfamily ATPase